MSSFESNSSNNRAGSDISTIRNTPSENEMSSRADGKTLGEDEIFIPPNNERFFIELELVQNLSNAKYLSYVVQNKYFQDPSFMVFLRYLRYFKEPEYLRHLIFPACLAFLDALIDNPRFRQELLSPVFIEHIHAQQGRFKLLFTGSLLFQIATDCINISFFISFIPTQCNCFKSPLIKFYSGRRFKYLFCIVRTSFIPYSIH
jgi:mediator of RNA polymerase II transcription subunit 31